MTQLWGWEPCDSQQRTDAIVKVIGELGLSPDFAVEDLACGTGAVLLAIKRAFPECAAWGVDIEAYPEWEEARAAGVKFLPLPIQTYLPLTDCQGLPISVVMMLSSYRNWTGTPQEKRELDEWLGRNARYFITSDAGRNDLPYPMTVIGKDAKDYDLVMYTIQ